MTEVGFGITRPYWRVRFGIWTEHFLWLPSEIDWGKSSPAELFNAPADEHWTWGWLFFVIYFARARMFY